MVAIQDLYGGIIGLEEGKNGYPKKLHDELLLFKEHLEDDLKRGLFLTVVEHINSYNLLLPEMNRRSSKVVFGTIDPKIYQLSQREEERLIKQGTYNQYFASILSTIAFRVDLWILEMRSILHIHGRKLVPDEVYNKLPNPIKKIMDETIGCYEHSYLTACAIMLRKALEDSIYLKFSMKNKVDEIYDKNKRRLSLEAMIQKSKDLHYVSSELADRLVKVKLFGDVGAHSFKIELWQGDLDQCIDLIRLVLDELFHNNHI